MTISQSDIDRRLTIRVEQAGDIDAIRAVNLTAFGQPDESSLVDDLRNNQGVLLSLVALLDGHIIGHILYSPIDSLTDDQNGPVRGAGLAPMAVLPDYQRLGIGTRLVEHGNRLLREDGCPFVIVLGHPEFYPRFGFEPASGHGIRCEWDVPDEAFMLVVFDETAMKAVTGLAKFRDEFSRFA